MTLHEILPERSRLHGRFAPSATPILTVESGDRIRASLPDVGWGLEAPSSTTAPRRKVANPEPGPCLLGPIAVRGLRRGDALEIAIERIVPAERGFTWFGGGIGPAPLRAALGFADAPLGLTRWSIDRALGVATDEAGCAVRIAPFLGTIGLAPDEANACPWSPRACGGNLDCRELVAGTSLHLPVEVEGGLLSFGDGHAAQGDGELAGTAIECAMEEVVLRLVARPGAARSGPWAERSDGTLIALGSGETLDEAAASAAGLMLDLMVERLGMSRGEALAHATARVDLRVTQLVNPRRGVHAVLVPRR